MATQNYVLCYLCKEKINKDYIANHGSRFLRNDEPVQEVCEDCYVDFNNVEPRWLKKHSVNCYFCGILFDEREGLNADDFNNNDGGSICQNCLMKKALIVFVIDHLKHFKCYPVEFEFEDKVIYFDEIMEILKNRKS
jgi:hypothetical protein|tara:strand:+ start:296 stop:706 length:411 start_codon:yes stop_codon:yes gene_type:complete